MKKFIRIGVDLAKNYFQVHALVSEGGKVASRKLTRAGMFKFFAEVEPCLVGMEARGSALPSQTKGLGAHAHGDGFWRWVLAMGFGDGFWRWVLAMGFDVKPMPPNYVKASVKRGKNDAADAAAIGESVSRPAMRFVAVKSAARQAALMPRKTREQLIKQRTMNVNALRGHLSEFGLVAAKGVERVKELGPRRPETTRRFPRPPRPA